MEVMNGENEEKRIHRNKKRESGKRTREEKKKKRQSSIERKIYRWIKSTKTLGKLKMKLLIQTLQRSESNDQEIQFGE